MTQAGIGVSPECAKMFERLKMGNEFHFIIFKITNLAGDAKVEPVLWEPKQTGDDFRTVYKKFESEMAKVDAEKDCAYAVVDFQYTKKGTDDMKNKIVYYSYCPDTSKPLLKMPYSATRESFKKIAFKEGIQLDVQGNDADDISFSTVEKDLNIADKY